MALDTQTNVDKEINEGILRTYLGVDDPTGIDFGTYKTLLREKIAAARMGGSDMDSSDISYLTNEFLRIKNIEPAKTKKIDINKFVKKAEEKKKKTKVSAQKLFEAAKDTAASSAPKAKKVSNQKLLPPSKITPTPQDEVDDFYGQDLDDLLNEIRNNKEETQAVIDNLKKESEEQKKILNMLTPSFASMEENLEDILYNTKEQTELREKAARQTEINDLKSERKDREAALESKGSKVGESVKKAEKATKPLGGFLDMILNFLKNILLGGALVALMNFIKDPGKMLDPVFDKINEIISFINEILTNIFNFIFDPINAVIKGVYDGLNAIENAINSAIGMLPFGLADKVPGYPFDNIDPSQAPVLKPPQIEPIKNPFSKSSGESEPQQQSQESQPQEKTQQTPPQEKTQQNQPQQQSQESQPQEKTKESQPEKPVPAMKGGGVVFSPIFDMSTPRFENGGIVNLNMGTPRFNSGGIVVKPNVNPQTVNDFAFTGGGSITSNSGQKISGMGVDTQLIATQPGEIVMSKPAVNYWGAGNLLAMNKQGGGTNIPKMGKVAGFRGGGSVGGEYKSNMKGLAGGVAGSPQSYGNDPKKRKIFLHWSGSIGHNSTFGPYHQLFNGSGQPRQTNVNYGVDNNEGTAGGNTNSVALAAAAMGHKGQQNGYNDRKGWAETPLLSAQTNAMAREAAALLVAYGQTTSDVDKNVFTHGEWERYAVKTGKLRPPVQRWDLDSLTPPGPNGYGHPGGFSSTQKVNSKGGDQMRAKIKAFMSGMPAPDLEEGQVDTPPVLENQTVSPATVPNNTTSSAATSSGASGSPVVSSSSSSKPTIPGAPSGGGTNVRLLPLGGGGKQQPGSSSNAGQTRVDGFSPIDLNNPELIVIKSIYNVVG